MTKRDNVSLKVEDLLEEIRHHLETNDIVAIRDLAAAMEALREWLYLNSFDRRTVNRRLKQYAANDDAWMWR